MQRCRSLLRFYNFMITPLKMTSVQTCLLLSQNQQTTARPFYVLKKVTMCSFQLNVNHGNSFVCVYVKQFSDSSRNPFCMALFHFAISHCYITVINTYFAPTLECLILLKEGLSVH